MSAVNLDPENMVIGGRPIRTLRKLGKFGREE
jgi:hypothetical protein